MSPFASKNTYNLQDKKPGFWYADGTEDVLLEIFQDPSVDVTQVWQRNTKWPLSYHLSPLRANIINWLDFGAKPVEILELGAGCGVITEYLTSLDNVKRLVAIEGSAKRAEIIKLRCKQTKNLDVVVCNIEDYESDSKFDVLLFNGVLEYAGKYVDDVDPVQYVLKRAVNLLKSTGVLILAIENQLGHKYLAGFNEDHYGVPFEGISGYPNYNGIRTFDKTSLRGVLKKVGLSEQRWFYPFPDYKMPTAILSEKSFSVVDFEWLDLLDLPTIDPSFPKKATFNEREFLKTLAVSGIVSTFMNSFLVFAAKANIPVLYDLDSLLAVKTSPIRGGKFKKTTYFRLSDNSDILVVRKFLKADNENRADHPEFEEESYWKGYKNLFNLIGDAIYHNQYEQVAEYLLKWLNLVYNKRITPNTMDLALKYREFCSRRLGVLPYSDSSVWLPGEYLDLIPYNLLLHADPPHDIRVIDQEWKLNTPIPFQFVIDRGMYFLQLKLRRLAKGDLLRPDGKWDLPPGLIDLLPDSVTSPDMKSLLYLEGWFQKAVVEGDLSYVLSGDDRHNTKVEFNKIYWISESSHISLRDKILDFAASMNITNRLANSMIARRYRYGMRKAVRRRRQQASFSKTVVVVVPMYKEDLTPDEEVSLKHLLHFLGKYDKYLIVPKTSKIGIPGFGIKRFPDKFFKSTLTYNKLMLSKGFYKTFSEYEYILIYQLDSLVFSDELIYWCKQGYDYIGAPWIKGKKIDNPAIYGICGNGGFSLRKVESFLKVIDCAKDEISNYGLNEDIFWSAEAVKYYPGFKIAPAEVAVGFSFELSPIFCYEQNNQKIPFGCHAWAKYDRNFWEPYLLK